MGIIDHYTSPSLPGGAISALILLFLRFLQFILAIAVIGLYAQDLNSAHRSHIYSDANWVYAVVVSTISCIVAIAFAVPKVPWWKGGWAMDICLLILWIALFGDFGAKYLNEKPENIGHGDGPGIVRMKNAVWVDLVNVFLWAITGLWGVAIFMLGKRRRTQHTGRAAA
jgi:hypothetical protein